MDPVRLQKKLGSLLNPLAALYRLILGVRRSVWETGLANRLRPSCPCISVGNIAWGGTGKTPITDWLMSWAERKKLRTVVLSRGYKADLSIAPVYVKSYHSPREVGDEPLMLGLDHPDCAVLVDPNRRRSGRYAMKSLSPELLLLDDGFQHLAVHRDLDMVLLRPADLRGEWGRVIPAGSWREGVSALKRAGVFLIKCDRVEMESLLPAFKTRLEVFQRPVFSFTLRPVALERVGAVDSGEGLGSRPYVLVSGVGNPHLVEDAAENFLGRPPEKHLVFPDHHVYSFKDTAMLEKAGLPLVCTRKDAVKLRRLPLKELWSLRVAVSFGPALWSPRTFPEWLETWWQQQKSGVLPQMSSEKNWTGFVASAGFVASTPFLSPVPPASVVPPVPEVDEAISSELFDPMSLFDTPNPSGEPDTLDKAVTPDEAVTPDMGDHLAVADVLQPASSTGQETLDSVVFQEADPEAKLPSAMPSDEIRTNPADSTTCKDLPAD